VLCVQDKTCKFFLPLSVIIQVINVLNGIWRQHLLSNKVCQNSCPLILDNNHSKFSVVCVRFMYKYFSLFLIRRRLSFLNTISHFLERHFLNQRQRIFHIITITQNRHRANIRFFTGFCLCFVLIVNFDKPFIHCTQPTA